MKILKIIWRTLKAIRFLLISFVLVLSLCINLALFLGGSLFSILNSGFEAVTNIQTIGSRNKAEIAQLGDNLSTERQAKRKLKTELDETTARLVSERKIKKKLATELSQNSPLVLFKGQKVTVKTAVEKTAEQIGKRSTKSAVRNVASMPGEAIPWIGVAVIVGVTALEISDLCLTMKDMIELQRAFDPSFEADEANLEVCSIKVPPKEDIIASVKGSPRAAWEIAREATPSLEDIKSIEMPDVKDWWTKSEGAITDFRGKISDWWNQ